MDTSDQSELDTAVMTTTKASDIFVRCLENEGVEHVFAVPGEENLDLLESLRQSKIRLILTRHEQGAAFMAATYGRMTGHAGVCMATLGPGATNLVTAAAYAHLGAMPLVMVTGQKPIRTSKQGRFQIIDVVQMMQPITKSARQIVDADMVAPLVRDAFRLAEEERPGAVHLELPEDIAAETTEDWHLYDPSPVLRPQAAEEAVERAAEMIREAHCPLLLVGAAANRHWVFEPLTRFVTALQLPFLNTQMGKGVISCEVDGFLGTAALSDKDLIHEAFELSDLVINVGHDVIEKPPFLMRRDSAFKVIHLNFQSADVDPVYFPHHQVVGDIGNAIERLGAKLSMAPLRSDHSALLRLRERIGDAIHADDDAAGCPVKPQRVVAEVRKGMAQDGVIALDNGVYKIWFARNYPTYRPNTVLLDNALATMGAGLPQAMGVALMYPKLQVAAVCGDGGFMMNSQELETAIRLELNLCVLVLRDDSYGMIRWKQADAGFPDWGLEFGNPDFLRYAESYGAHGHRVEAPEDISRLLRHAAECGGVHLIEVPVDYSENDKI